jgi:hypothetical protein
MRNWVVRQEDMMSTTKLTAIFLLTAGVFFVLGFGVELGQILAASG